MSKARFQKGGYDRTADPVANLSTAITMLILGSAPAAELQTKVCDAARAFNGFGNGTRNFDRQAWTRRIRNEIQQALDDTQVKVGRCFELAFDYEARLQIAKLWMGVDAIFNDPDSIVDDGRLEGRVALISDFYTTHRQNIAGVA